ncbi:nitroreductase family protein [Candidatus Saccharibacteria bacterium]|nr:nitroreductase family protein [Candidatus Saccharibacteria bacterium]MBQ3445121.1 nitroreductase family protein [Candidatus Saccharibacteria bacterium]
MEEKDIYQERYLRHQQEKKAELIEIMKERHSNRRFSDKPIPNEVIEELIKVVDLAPSSCDRKAIKVKVITDKDKKALLGGILVGGVGWIHRAPAILLITADPNAYKAGNEIDFMPYLDGGVVSQQLALMATALGIHGCFANPNIRDFNKDHYHKIFGPEILTMAFAIGYPIDQTPAK